MATETMPPRSSSAPVELSHLSFAGLHHQSTPAHPVYEGATLPLPPSSSPSHSHASHHSQGSGGGTSSSRGYILVELPQELPLYSAGAPILTHFMEAGNEAVNRDYRYRVPAADRYDFVREDRTLRERREYFLHIFEECFPSESQRLGRPIHSNSAIYNFFSPC